MNLLQQIGQAIAQKRKDKDWSQGQLAQNLNVNRSYISSLEGGLRNPSVLTLERIARALETSLQSLISDAPYINTKAPSDYPLIAGHLVKQLSRWKNKQWYHQRFDGCPYLLHLIAEAHVFTDQTLKENTDFTAHFCFFDGGKADWFHLNEDIQRVSNTILKYGANNPFWVKKFIKKWDLYEQAFVLICDQISKTSLRDLSQEKLTSLHKKFVETILHRNSSSSTIDGFALGTDTLLYEQLNNAFNSSRLTKKYKFQEFFSKITAPIYHSFLDVARIELLKLALQLRDHRSNKRELLLNYQRNFFWIKNNYIDSRLISLEEIETEIAQLYASGRDIEQELKAAQLAPQNNQSEKKKLLKNIKLTDETRFLINTTDEFTRWQDERKRATLITAHYATCLLDEIANRVGISSNDLKFLSSREVELILKEPTSKKEIKKRKQSCVFYWDRNGHDVASGQNVIKIYNQIIPKQSLTEDIHDFRGLTASTGKAIGTARLIQTVKEIHKIRRGDILVAIMTRPDYAPAMKLASAIVTNEGGITSHAAIVARELGIPCVIGTKIATEVLHDGDLIEVNANHGVVKILKRARSA